MALGHSRGPAGDTLLAAGRIGINTTEATHPSAFIGAVVSTLPSAVGLRRPARVELVAHPGDPAALPQLEPGQVYRWDELAEAFGFRPAFLSVAGGIVPSSATGALPADLASRGRKVVVGRDAP
jgi:hypothetical protein